MSREFMKLVERIQVNLRELSVEICYKGIQALLSLYPDKKYHQCTRTKIKGSSLLHKDWYRKGADTFPPYKSITIASNLYP